MISLYRAIGEPAHKSLLWKLETSQGYIFSKFIFPPPPFSPTHFFPKSKRAIEVFPKPIFFPQAHFFSPRYFFWTNFSPNQIFSFYPLFLLLLFLFFSPFFSFFLLFLLLFSFFLPFSLPFSSFFLYPFSSAWYFIIFFPWPISPPPGGGG